MRLLVVALILFGGILIFSVSVVTVFLVIPVKNKQANDCFETQNNVSDLIKCLSVHFLPKGSLSWFKWQQMLPSNAQRTNFQLVIIRDPLSLR